MKKLVFDIINKLDLPSIDYADVRLTNTDEQTVYFEKGQLKYYGSELDSVALGIRVLANGCWGFAGTKDLSNKAIEKTVKKAIHNAKTGSRFRKEPAVFKKLPVIQDSYFFKPEEDPFLMDDKYKIDYHEKIAKKLTGNKKIVYSHVYSEFYRQYKIFIYRNLAKYPLEIRLRIKGVCMNFSEELVKICQQFPELKFNFHYRDWETDFLRFYQSQINYNITKKSTSIAVHMARPGSAHGFFSI